VLIGLVVALAGDDEDDVSSGASTTTDAPATTEAATTETTAEPRSPGTESAPTSPGSEPSTPTTFGDPATAVWPTAADNVTFDDPEKVAAAFATDILGFTDPAVGKYIRVDDTIGEVDIRAAEEAPNTIIFVRRLGPEGSWSVVGASSNHIQPESPPGSRTFGSPLGVQGRSTSPDGTVTVELRPDGSTQPLGKVVATGGGTGGNFTRFSGWLSFTTPPTDAGMILYTTRSPDGSRVWAAAASRVRYR
jgi:hypothetical protein